MKLTKMHRSLSLLLMLGCVFLATGCIIPVRTTTAVQNLTGQKQPLPKEAIVPGRTTREQIEQEYKSFAIDSGAPSLLWGRFRKSQWAVLWGVCARYGAPGCAGADCAWGTYNLLVSFDSEGHVKTSETVRDKELVDRFVRNGVRLGVSG